jgi:hypothetical protein
LEGHKLGPPPRLNAGPLFAVGYVIMCDVPGRLYGLDPGWSLLQQGFFLEAKDPRYKIQLENGVLTSGIKVKSLIKYFAIPKREMIFGWFTMPLPTV